MQFRLREVRFGEIDKIKEFYSQNPDKHVMPRPDDILKKAIDDGYLFAVFASNFEYRDKIVAVSGCYASKFDNKIYMEAGGSRINENYQGLGLHRILHSVRALTAHINEEDLASYFGAIICPNPPSVTNIVRCGFIKWENPPQELVNERAIYAGEGECIEYFYLPKSELKSHANSVIDIVNKDYFIKSEKKVRLKLDIKISSINMASLIYISRNGLS